MPDTLFGRGAVHTPDGVEHELWKRPFLDALTDPDGVPAPAHLAGPEWHTAMAGCRGQEIGLFDEVVYVLARAVGTWTGLPGADDATTRRLARDCVATVDGFAKLGPRRLRARRARARQEKLLWRGVEDARARAADTSPQTPSRPWSTFVRPEPTIRTCGTTRTASSRSGSSTPPSSPNDR